MDYEHLIDGEGVAGELSAEFITWPPRRCWRRSPGLDRAVAAATRAFPGWRHTPVALRQALLATVAVRTAANADQLALVLSQEQGKPRATE